MENLFLYGVSGADLDDCDSFLHGLNQQANKQDAQDTNNSRVYIPSPQGMLNTGIDPYAPQDNFDQMFVLDQNQWDYPQPEPRYEQQRWSGPRSLPSPPIKSESDSSPQDDETYVPDQRDISVEASGIAKKGGARQRKTKTSHNMIEKRYRNNINDKINMLRDSVPTLREAAATPLVDGIPSIRLNKATVLTKAAEYIEQLKSRNKMLQKENSELRARVSGNRRPQFHAPPPHGVVPVPPQDYYHHQHQHPQAQQQQQQQAQQQQQQQQHQGRSTGTNLALGCATAGLVTTGSVLSSGDGNFRGLSALPIPSAWKFLPRPSTSSVKLTFVAFVCFLIGSSYVSLLSKWSTNMGKSVRRRRGVVQSSDDQKLNAMDRLGLPQQPSHWESSVKILLLIPQALFCLVFSIRTFEQLKSYFGGSVDPQLGYFLDRVIDADLTGTDKASVSHLITTFLMSFLSETPARQMLQGVQLKQLLCKVHLDNFAKPLINRMWMRPNKDLPQHVQNLAKIPLFDITDVEPTHLTINGDGVKVSNYVINNVQDPQILSVLDLFACTHAYTLQDHVMLNYLENGSVDQDKVELSIEICPSETVATLRHLGVEALLAPSASKMDQVISKIKQSTDQSPCMHQAFPYLIACSMTQWYAGKSGSYAETILPEFNAPLMEWNSSLLFSSCYLALKSLAENGLGRSNLIQPALDVRAWLGSSDAADFGLSAARRKQLIKETLGFANDFASREMDEACSIPDEVVEATLLEA